jgi:hypothetical protein
MNTKARLLVEITRDASVIAKTSGGTELRTEILGIEVLHRCGWGTPIRMRADANLRRKFYSKPCSIFSWQVMQ